MSTTRAPMTDRAGNVVHGASRVHRPATVDELRRLVAGTPRDFIRLDGLRPRSRSTRSSRP